MLTAAIGELEKQTVGALEEASFPEARVAFAGFFSRARTSYVREALRAKTERDLSAFTATANEAVNRRIASIGRASGYGNLANFNRKFLAETGITPSAYRNMDAESKPEAKLLSLGLINPNR